MLFCKILACGAAISAAILAEVFACGAAISADILTEIFACGAAILADILAMHFAKEKSACMAAARAIFCKMNC